MSLYHNTLASQLPQAKRIACSVQMFSQSDFAQGDWGMMEGFPTSCSVGAASLTA